MHSLTKRNLRRKNFSLVELIVVITIIALLSAIVVPKFFVHMAKAKRATAVTQIKNLKQAVETFELACNRYPTSSEGLEALIKNPGDVAGWEKPFLDSKTIPKDPWGNDYIYKIPGDEGQEFTIISYGKDKQEGGKGENADISSY